jgi:hypothetical protein
VKSVEDLRREGFKVRVYVDRIPFHTGEELTTSAKEGYLVTCGDVMEEAVPMQALRKITGTNKIWGFGGVTKIDVWEPERKDESGAPPDYAVVAVCSIKDQFKKRVGHDICLGRLNILLSGKHYVWPMDYQGERS